MNSIQIRCYAAASIYRFVSFVGDDTTMDSVAEEILREILLSLPTRDAARCCCVSRLWCGVVTDPTFRALHARARHVVAGTSAEALLVSEIRDPGKSLEVRVYSINSPKPMCRVLGLAGG